MAIEKKLAKRKPRRTPEQILQDNKDRYFSRRLKRFLTGLGKVARKHPDIQIEHSLGTTQIKKTFTRHARGQTQQKKVLQKVPELVLDFVKVDPQTGARHRVQRFKGPIDYRYDDHKAIDFQFSVPRGPRHADRRVTVDLHFNAAASYVAEMVAERLDNPTKKIIRTSESNPGDIDAADISATTLNEDAIRLEEMDKEVTRAFKRLEKNLKNRFAINRPIFKNVDVFFHPIDKTVNLHFNVMPEHRVDEGEFDLKGIVKIERGARTKIMFKITEGAVFDGLESDPLHISEHDKTGKASVAIYNMIERSGFLKDTAHYFAPRIPTKQLTREEQIELDIKSKLAPRFNRRGRPTSRPSNRREMALEHGRGDFGRYDDLRNKEKRRRRHKAEQKHRLMTENYDALSDDYAKPIPPGAYKPGTAAPRHLSPKAP